jgi:hypothetical protein
MYGMLKELIEVYKAGLLNKGVPECLFPETLIFNEGWLLRTVLAEWKAGSAKSRFGFLPFPDDAKIYSEGQLYTPFKARFRGDKQTETHTHVDGVIGHFSISGTKSGIVLEPDFKYVAAFEAKMYSALAKGTKNAPYYDQVSRTAACLINCVLQVGRRDDYRAHLVVLYSDDNRHIGATQYTKTYIEKRIAERLRTYIENGGSTEATELFVSCWKDVLKNLQVWFLAWEKVLTEIASDDLSQFYDLCRRFNRRSKTIKEMVQDVPSD